MTPFVLVFSLSFTAVMGLLFGVIRTLLPPGLPLGVRVPQSHAGDPVIRSAVRRFRAGLVIAWLISAAVAVGLAALGHAPVAIVLPVLLNTALGIAALVISRRAILRAKTDGNWFDDVPVRMTAELTPVDPPHPSLVWPVLAAIVLALATAVEVAQYPHLPDPLPTHYGLDGVANGFAAKSIWSVFGVLMIGAVVAALLTGLSFVAARYSVRPQADDTADQSRLRIRVQRRALTSLLSELAFVVAFGISALVLAQRLLPGVRAATGAAAILLLVLVLAVVFSSVLRARSALQPANVRDSRNPRPDGADDDRFWKGGILYLNRDDPSVLVPRRFGLGWTVNLGRPLGAALGILALLVVVAVVVVAVLLGVRAR